MKNLRYVYKTGEVIHVLNAKVSTNSKIGLGYIVQTYHFGIEQILTNDIKFDSASCLDCPLSYNQNNGKSGGCYTHKGYQLMGLKSMFRKLNNDIKTIKDFDKASFDKFITKLQGGTKIDLVRFGAYGEPILMDLYVVTNLSKLSRKSTGYTHQWNKDDYQAYNKFFMASTHTETENFESSKLGFRSFFVAENKISCFKPLNAVNCPASKESSKSLTCISCGLCNGNKAGIKKDIYILQH